MTGSVSSRALLRGLTVARERDRGFSRSRFGTWLDADLDGCTTRDEVLLAESLRPPLVLASCTVTSGRWRSRLNGARVTDLAKLRIGPHVPFREAWQSGARRWSPSRRAQLANDLGYRPTLHASTLRAFEARGAAGPERWLPPRRARRCAYVAEWVAVKWRWRMTVDRAERRFLVRRLRGCGWPAVERPTRATST